MRASHHAPCDRSVRADPTARGSGRRRRSPGDGDPVDEGPTHDRSPPRPGPEDLRAGVTIGPAPRENAGNWTAGEEHPWRDTAMKITNEILEAYLNCKTKGHMKVVGETGTKSDYEAMTEAARRSSREVALAGIVARFGEGNAYRGTAVTAAMLKQGAPLLADAIVEDDGMSIRFDGLKRA